LRRNSLPRLAALGILIVALTMLSACASGGANMNPKIDKVDKSPGASAVPEAAGHAVVTITDTAFDPASVRVRVGSQVVWTNSGKSKHAISIPGEKSKSPAVAPGKTAAHTFKKAGTFKYTDPSHPGLKGTVIVVK